MNFFTGLWGRFRELLFPQAVVEREFGVHPATSLSMEKNIGLWYALYTDTPPWEDCDVKPLGIPSAICKEVARPVLVEFEATISGSQRADWLMERFTTAAEHFKRALEVGLALGGVCFKPYIYDDRLLVDVTSAAAFQPTKFDPSGTCIGGVFRDKPVRIGKDWYIRLESHMLDNGIYTVQNKAYHSDSSGTVGAAAELTEVPEWADIPPEVTIEGMTGPLFAYFKPPVANTVDPSSPCGMSIFGDKATIELLKQADQQWEQLRWEFKSSERKVFMEGNTGIAEMFDERMFEFGNFSPEGNFFQNIEPSVRDDAFYRGFQNILRRVEFNVGLSYGDISDPQTVEKTATEIRNGKQRKYVLVDSIQKALEHTFDALVYAMDVYATLYGLAPAGGYEVTYDWGDSILDDQDTKDKEFARDLQLTSAGIMNDWELRAKYFAEDEATAKAHLPKAEDMTTEPEEEVE